MSARYCRLLTVLSCLFLGTVPVRAQDSGKDDRTRPDFGHSSDSSSANSASKPQESPFDVKATVTGVTDYVSLRGFSQTDRKPALQGTIDANYNDLHVGFFTSNVDFGPGEPHLEFDPFVAYRPTFGPISLDITAYYYFYFDAPDSDYPEIFSTISYEFPDIATVGATFAYAPDYFGQSDTGYFYRGNLSIPLPKNFTLSGTAGYQFFAEDKYREHLVWDAGLNWKYSDDISFDVRYHDTDIDASRFCVGIFQCGPTVVGSISVSTSLSEIRNRFAGR